MSPPSCIGVALLHIYKHDIVVALLTYNHYIGVTNRCGASREDTAVYGKKKRVFEIVSFEIVSFEIVSFEVGRDCWWIWMGLERLERELV